MAPHVMRSYSLHPYGSTLKTSLTPLDPQRKSMVPASSESRHQQHLRLGRFLPPQQAVFPAPPTPGIIPHVFFFWPWSQLQHCRRKKYPQLSILSLPPGTRKKLPLFPPESILIAKRVSFLFLCRKLGELGCRWTDKVRFRMQGHKCQRESRPGEWSPRVPHLRDLSYSVTWASP